MKAAPTARQTAAPPTDEVEEPEDATANDGFDETDAEEEEGPDELAEETGIDLTDASELDADNVPADEEHDRVMQAPD